MMSISIRVSEKESKLIKKQQNDYKFCFFIEA